MNTIEKTKTEVMKKEKRTKVVPTQEQVDKMVLDYLKGAEKHAFQTKYVWDKEYTSIYKVFPANIDGKACYVTVTINGDKVEVEVRNTSWVTTKNQLGMLKNNVFRQEMKHKSIKLDSEMKLKMEIIKTFVESSIDAENLKSDIKRILK